MDRSLEFGRLRTCLDGALPQAGQFTSIGVLPYGFLRRMLPSPGVFFVGDQMAVIPSLTGDGMTIALMTAKRAVQAMIETVDDEARFTFRAASVSRLSTIGARPSSPADRCGDDVACALQKSAPG